MAAKNMPLLRLGRMRLMNALRNRPGVSVSTLPFPIRSFPDVGLAGGAVGRGTAAASPEVGRGDDAVLAGGAGGRGTAAASPEVGRGDDAGLAGGAGGRGTDGLNDTSGVRVDFAVPVEVSGSGE